MITLVEDVLTEVIETRLKWLKSNVDIVDRIFRGASVTNRNRLKEYLKGDTIKVMRGFPVDRTYLPSYVILLGAEREATPVLGSYLGDDEGTFDLGEANEVLRVQRHDGMNAVKVSHKPIFQINSVTYQGEVYDLECEILDEKRGLVLLDFPVNLEVEDTVEINYVFKDSGTEEYGTYYNSQYRVETWTENGDLTVILYHLLTWIFLCEREKLAEAGLVAQNLGGMDFEPAPEYFPAFVYRRAFTFECTLEKSYEVDYKFISEIDVKDDSENL